MKTLPTPKAKSATLARTAPTLRFVDVMLDLETMGSAPGCSVIAIGAVPFGANGIDEERSFYQVVDLTSCCAAGLEMDPATVLWWLRQSDAARREFERPGQPLVEVLGAFKAWLWTIADKRTVRVWGNGASFDQPILTAAYRAVDQPQPWEFYHDRCFRTVKAAYSSVPYVKPTQAHNALIDATAQAEHLVKLCAAGLVLA